VPAAKQETTKTDKQPATQHDNRGISTQVDPLVLKSRSTKKNTLCPVSVWYTNCNIKFKLRVIYMRLKKSLLKFHVT